MQIQDCGVKNLNEFNSLNDNDKQRVLDTLIQENNKIKTGLVWKAIDSTVEDVSRKNSYPVVKRYPKFDLNSELFAPQNALVCGDNYQLLRLLQGDYKNRFGLIYVDAPYNIGGDWIFNGEVVSETDTWSQDKWSSFMWKRFKLMRELLQPYGMVAVSISSVQLGQLLCLLDEIFGRKNQVSVITVVTNKGGKMCQGVKDATEYLVVYAKNAERALQEVGLSEYDLSEDSEDRDSKSRSKNYCIPVAMHWDCTDDGTVKKIPANKRKDSNGNKTDKPYIDGEGTFGTYSFKKTGKGSKREESPDNWYPIYYYANLDSDSMDFNPVLSVHPQQGQGWYVITPKTNGQDSCWRWVYKSMEEYIAKLAVEGQTYCYAKGFQIKYDQKEGLTLFTKYRDKFLATDKETKTAYKAQPIKSFWDEGRYQNQTATKRLNAITGSNKEVCKPVGLLEDIIFAFSKPGDLLGDFFAGTGTFLEAMGNINKKFNRGHRCIMGNLNTGNYVVNITLDRLGRLAKGELANGTTEPPLKEKLIVYAVSELNVDEDDDIDDIIEEFLPSMTDYYSLVHGADYVCFNNDGCGCIANVSENKVYMLCKKMYSPRGDTAKLYEQMNEYLLNNAANYQKFMIEASHSTEPIRDDLFDRSINITTYPVPYIRGIERVSNIKDKLPLKGGQ